MYLVTKAEKLYIFLSVQCTHVFSRSVRNEMMNLADLKNLKTYFYLFLFTSNLEVDLFFN